MIKLNPIKSEKIWGYESWKASTHPNGRQEELAAQAGDYPLIVKVIQADKTLSVQVHPDNEKAEMYEGCRGKTECWYVLSAEEGAEIVCGLNGVYTASELRNAIEANSLQDCLRYVKVRKGDFIFIPAGTVHAICGGLRLLEVQQSSDITYRLYDWGRGRECNVERGIACIKHEGVRNAAPFMGVFSCPYFELEEIECEGSYYSAMPKGASALAFVISGSGAINGIAAQEEDVFSFDAGEKMEASGNMRLMKIIPAERK